MLSAWLISAAFTPGLLLQVYASFPFSRYLPLARAAVNEVSPKRPCSSTVSSRTLEHFCLPIQRSGARSRLSTHALQSPVSIVNLRSNTNPQIIQLQKERVVHQVQHANPMPLTHTILVHFETLTLWRLLVHLGGRREIIQSFLEPTRASAHPSITCFISLLPLSTFCCLSCPPPEQRT